MPAAGIRSPVTYGFHQGVPDPLASPLVSGRRHLAWIAVYEECDDDPDNCAQQIAGGCTTFVMP